MSERLSDVVLAALTQQVAGEMEHVLVSRIHAMGIATVTVGLNTDSANELRRVVRRIIGETALQYRAAVGSDDANA
ncbi:hypothetical protein C8K18_12513 [Paraburkholderia sp. GV068]|jgi:hypothetical protein|nr:hypothetical protein C8K19_12513 [Paraburkholderia sp. GV072]PUA94060.1 hypothetical protein C8K18_12513 [Paraburkholderia sp. GV068]